VLRKSDLKEIQQAEPPFGGLTTVAPGRMGHLFLSPGPIFDPEGARPDPWRGARALWAAGIRPGQVLQNCFGYHLTPGAWMVDLAARHIGCAVIPAGANDAMTLKCETAGAPEGLAARLEQTVREVTQLRGAVEWVSVGSLPNDGKVIEDARRYD
jgi:phenylacetate-CoA ligase